MKTIALLGVMLAGCSGFGNFYDIVVFDRTTAKLDEVHVEYGSHHWELGANQGGFTEEPPDFVVVDWKLKSGETHQQKVVYASRLPSRLRNITIYFVFDDDSTVKMTWATNAEIYGDQTKKLSDRKILQTRDIVERKLGPPPKPASER